MFFVEMVRAGSRHAPGPFNFRGRDLEAEWRPAKAQVRARFPATAPAPSAQSPSANDPIAEPVVSGRMHELGDRLLSIGYSRSDRPRASLRNRVSKTQFARGSTEAACQLRGVVADK